MRLFAGAVVAFGLLAGCASAVPEPEAGAGSGPLGSLDLHGSRIIGCCCQTPCSCRVNKKPMHCHGCDFTTAVHIDRGHVGATDMSGVTWVIVGRGFGENPEADWVYVYVSDKCSDAQVEALKGMLQADMEDWKKRGKAQFLAGTFKGLRKAPVSYTVSADRRTYDCSIDEGRILDIRTQAIVLPGHTEPARLSGIFDAFGDAFVQAECLSHKYNDPETGYRWDLTGRQSNQADFLLDDARLARGGIGWGCWSAHESLGDTSPYPEQMKDDPK
jgi:hypothetical protein